MAMIFSSFFPQSVMEMYPTGKQRTSVSGARDSEQSTSTSSGSPSSP